MDIKEMLKGIKPYLLAPQLDTITNLSNPKKPKRVAQIIVKAMCDSIEAPETIELYHDGRLERIRYFDPKPLLKGSWAEISLMLLQLSYQEQILVIESIYPKGVQLTAKAFAATFTKTEDKENIVVQEDPKLIHKLNAANAGIALIVSMLQETGHKTSHPDSVVKELKRMNNLASQQAISETYQNAITKADQANKFNDRQQ
jgi:hypothetical protein